MDFAGLFEIAPFYLFSIILPLLIIFWQIIGKNESKLDWIIRFVFGISFFAWIYFLLPWGTLNYYLRYIFLALFLITSIYSLQKSWLIKLNSKNSLKSKKLLLFKKLQLKDYLFYACLLIASILFLITVSTCIRAQSYSKDVIQLDFPLKNGTYYFAQAGSNIALNYHGTKSQKYAYDIIKLDSLGFRGKSFFPINLTDFYIFEENVYSPCNGIVIEVINSSIDMPFMQRNETDPNGNHVILDCEGARVSLIHFKKESIIVKENEKVFSGQLLGKIGNSGRTTEPHLHIHAENNNGEGIPIAFNGKTFSRNDILNAK